MFTCGADQAREHANKALQQFELAPLARTLWHGGPPNRDNPRVSAAAGAVPAPLRFFVELSNRDIGRNVAETATIGAMGLFGNWPRGRAMRKASLDERLWERVLRSLPFLRGLTAGELSRLRELAVRFLAEKELHGAHGFALSDEIRLSIALQACLPVLNLGLDPYSGWVGIVVYPGEFRVQGEEMDEHGVVHSYSDALSGEAWPGGPVVLSWQDAGSSETGYNVVIHEFAHKIHMRMGEEDGFPPPQPGMDAAHWQQQWQSAYDRFCAEVDAERPTVIDPYASEHPAEFFAVMSEVFFTDSAVLARDWPGLYRELAQFYRQDPAGLAPSDK